jgi:hypothetical protein
LGISSRVFSSNNEINLSDQNLSSHSIYELSFCQRSAFVVAADFESELQIFPRCDKIVHVDLPPPYFIDSLCFESKFGICLRYYTRSIGNIETCNHNGKFLVEYSIPSVGDIELETFSHSNIPSDDIEVVDSSLRTMFESDNNDY